MQFIKYKSYILKFLLVSCIFCINGCDCTILCPNGLIAQEQRFVLFVSFFTMLLIIIPVIFMTIFFVLRYRESNFSKTYDPKWSHSNIIELLIWGIPIIIIVFLSIFSWKSVHDLDPKKPIVSNVQPIKINVISLDWKWLFIYPDQKIATINKLIIPINTPIIFNLTSGSVMNSFFIPSLGSQIYVMPGMKTNLNLIANKLGQFKGFSSNYSGKGFSNMKFDVLVTSDHIFFYEWVKKIQKSKYKLNSMYQFNQLAIPSDNNAIKYFSNLKENLFNVVIANVLKISL
ncbi:ubiquinol oxidase subunit II [Buchnera aphidicola]|uniref:Cytochrome bo(3) ubiquinol oxidase subunit 2 n=1 Tax=Buchnera aphidicola subsp. Baizongia pistaciae (strain Bp) TaxID=224915 RepID=CYOA_BUCBP|nr:ubiquinol oxidase subunit II [Buchnera aphidicola]Q89AA3.2 RecName: Full=Cytochrome bo(3) ubiquinol oxidase subunit 2; AltName: Full=Cytochrome o ubiquinol oxidase subunit 2; Short=Cytochrome o subunit 2; AltName: Full=Oxidase bo(3) subunit 2; AltName: Full=Ubiquinol oxidase polypeptide II; AltName: Full=Ubiquinol oxidase subunit 2; Flags: Precursor [Buchnera aphidicola str. Bp (Baizongia pistaciae)]